MAKEGENYLDQLLNTVAPDWEETSSSPDIMSASEDEVSIDDVSLEDALSILNDLPDEMDMGAETPDEEFGGMTDVMSDIPENTDTDMELPEIDEMGMPELDEIPLPDEEDDSLEEEMMPVLDDVSDVAGDDDEIGLPDMEETDALPEEELDIPLAMEDFMQDEEMVPEEELIPPEEELMSEEGLMPEDALMSPVEGLMSEDALPEEEPKPAEKDSIDVDDIFQDALSAVGYSGNDEDGESDTGDGQGDDLFSLEDVAEYVDVPEEGISSVPVADPAADAGSRKKKSKGPGFFARIFGNIVTDQTADEEEKERQAELAAKAKKAAEKEEKKQQAAVTKEEKAQQSQEEKERKKELKAERAAKKAEEKEEKKRRKAEMAAEAEKEVVGKINPVGATIVVIFFVTICAFTIFGSKLLSRNMSLNNAENYFANEEYLKAYDAISNVNVKEDDEVLYQRIRLCSQMQKEVKSYTNYTSMNMRLEALDSLIKGIRYYDAGREQAEMLGITKEVNSLGSQIITGLSEGFGVSEAQARELGGIEDMGEYTRRLEQIAAQTQPAA